MDVSLHEGVALTVAGAVRLCACSLLQLTEPSVENSSAMSNSMYYSYNVFDEYSPDAVASRARLLER